MEKIGALVGRVEAASALFKPRVDTETVEAIAKAMLQGLKVAPTSVTGVADMAQLPSDRVKPWATQTWINVVTELNASDPEMKEALAKYGYLPSDPAAIALYKRKLNERFICFLWIFGGDFANCFTIRLLVFTNAIRIEDLQATLDGKPGGWGILDSTVNGAKLLASATKQWIRTVATNQRVEEAFRKRGFVDATGDFAHTAKARPLELPPPA